MLGHEFNILCLPLFQKYKGLAWCYISLVSSTCELEKDTCEFVAILISIVSFKPFRVMY